MRILKCIYIYFVGITLISAQSEQTIYSPENLGISNIKLNELKSRLHEFVDHGQLAGIQTAIIKNGKLVLFDSYGYANIEDQKRLNDSSIFRIFSMTKPITSIALMQLYEAGMFKLEDPIHLYIPAFKTMKVFKEDSIVDAEKDIRIIDLLRHTSGITYGRSANLTLNEMYQKAQLEEARNLTAFVEKLGALPLLFEPGTNWEYSYATDVCGYLIEILSGKPLDKYLEEFILKPLEMDNTFFQLPLDKLNQLTVGYRADQNGALHIAELPRESRFLYTPTIIRGGGGLLSTTSDYLKFCQMLLNKGSLLDKQIVKPETINLMIQDHLKPVRDYTPNPRYSLRDSGFGLGFAVSTEENEIGSGIYGWGGAVGTYFRIDPHNDMAYVMMIQLSPYRQLNLSTLFQDLVIDALIE